MLTGLLGEVDPLAMARIEVRMMEDALTRQASQEALLVRHETLLHQCEAAGVEWGRLPTWREVLALIAERHELSVEQLQGMDRSRAVAWPRQEAMYVLHELRRHDGTHRFSLPQIGRFLGDRDHTTILFGIRRHLARLEAARADRGE